MATKNQHRHVLLILNKFIESLEVNGHVKGFSFSFTKRKIQLEKLESGSSLIIKSDIVYLHSELYSASAIFKRYKTEEAHFQQECNNEIFCDEEMEDAISKMFKLYMLYISDELEIGGYKRYTNV